MRSQSRSKVTLKPGKRPSKSRRKTPLQRNRPRKGKRLVKRPPGVWGTSVSANPATERMAFTPLPSSYGHNLIVLQPRDPRWLHAYWELTPAHVAQGRAKLGAEEGAAVWILRVYEEESPRWFDVDLSPGASDWTLQVESDRTWLVEIGLRALSGRFVPLARSNRVRTPPDRPSERIDPEWGPIDSLSAGWPSPSSEENPAR